MVKSLQEGPLISPLPGRPCWRGLGDLPLIYLGWGGRDFAQAPLGLHCDRATDYYIVLRGEIIVTTASTRRVVRGPTGLLIDHDCVFGLTQSSRQKVDVLVWAWQGRPILTELCPWPGTFLALDLQHLSLDSLVELHMRCRNEVSRADCHVAHTLMALRELVEVEILRASQSASPSDDFRWKSAHSWMVCNLAINAPVPALCDYLRMSPSTLNRFFHAHVGLSPGAYFRDLKVKEAWRLIQEEGWQVKAAAYHLGYSHPNDLSRALLGHRLDSHELLGAVSEAGANRCKGLATPLSILDYDFNHGSADAIVVDGAVG